MREEQRNKNSYFIRYLTYFVLFPLFALETAIFGSLAMLASFFDRDGRLQHAIARRWAGCSLRIALSPVQVLGAENLRKQKVAVYACNHLSYMDTPALFRHLPFQFRILARHDLFRLPFIGWYLRRSGQIPVDTTSLRSTITSLNVGVRALQAGTPLVIFPEGGRSGTGQLQELQNGAAYLALRARVPLVPMALVGTYELMPMHTYHVRPRPLYLIVGKPIFVEDLTSRDTEALTARLHRAISDLYMQHSEQDSAQRNEHAPREHLLQ